MSEKKETSLVKATESAMAIQVTPQSVREYLCPLATDEEVALFINQCVMFQLNPYKREIYLIKYSAKDKATFVVGYETYLKRAERTGKMDGWTPGVTFDKEGRLLSAWVDVYRKDWTHPLHHKVYLSEYLQTKEEWVNGARTGRRLPTKFWAEKPITMLKKVVVAQAFRMAFPDEMAGMPYTAEEMPVEHSRLPLEEVTPKGERPVAGLPEAIPGHSTGGPGAGNAAYEESKKRPLKDIKDEFTGGAEPQGDNADEPVGAERSFGEEIGAEFAKPKPTDFCSADKVQKISDLVAVLVGQAIDESMVWRAIIKKVRENFDGKVVVEMSDLTEAEADWIIDYLKRWSKAAAKGGSK